MTSDLTFIERTFDKAIVQVSARTDRGLQAHADEHRFPGPRERDCWYFNYKQRGSAKIAYGFDRNGPDTIDANGTIIKVPILQTQVKIPHRSFQMMVDNGVPLSNDIAFDMIRAINIQVDGLVINGWTEDGVTYESLGMSQIPGTAVTGATVQTFGNTYKAIQKAIAAMVLAGINAPAYNALMNPVQAGILKGSLNANSGNPEMAMVLDALNPNGGNTGQFFQRSNVPAGYMIVAPAPVETSKAYFDLIETVAPVHNAWFDNGNENTGDVWIEQYTCLVRPVQAQRPCIANRSGYRVRIFDDLRFLP